MTAPGMQAWRYAEQWAEAMQSYKAVLRSASPRAPIKPAAERIKILAKEHPEVSKIPAPAARPNYPNPLDQ